MFEVILGGLRTSESCFRAILKLLTIFLKKNFDFKTACEKQFFTIGLVRALKMSFYGAHYRTEMSILGLPVSLSASEDEKHDHTQLFT